MKKLIRQILIFFIPVFIGLILLPVNKRARFVELKDDCFNHGIWVYDRIHNNSENIDIAFLGSSHTLNGINDKLISEKLDSLTAVNFGYCRYGRNFHYDLLQEILSEYKIKKLVVEVREGENRSSHPIYPFIADTKDIFLNNSIANREFFYEIWTHHAYKLELFQDKIYDQATKVSIRKDNYGFASHPDTASASYLNKRKLKNSNTDTIMSDIQRNIEYKFGRDYQKKIAALCQDNNIEIYYLFLPSFASACGIPKEFKIYQKFGKLIIPPDSIYDDMDNWWDHGHLNFAGADKISLWLANELTK
ncbi:MAG: hypothetical protein JXA77_02170 [Bacteroidales bacterium]|nr:hypothetical protein [Bacteroidales bacterium]MBN2820061.1 hypothetical protein [Bacteroidales bacterium]